MAEESTVFLLDGASGQAVEASLYDEIGDDQLLLWTRSWAPEMQRHVAAHPLDSPPEDAHWNWRLKALYGSHLLSTHAFSLLCRGELQALMIARDLASAKLPEQFGKPMVYVEFLATAPWNRPDFQQPVRYKGCGRTMILAAIEVSRACGGRGRIGLHSLPAAEAFYREKCGMSALGRDAAHHQMMYFEMSETQAEDFRRHRPQP